MYLVEVKNVVKRYKNHLALDDVSVSIRRGTIFGLLGPNGAGKTTLIRIINRITAPDKGEIYFDGHLFDKKDIARIGYLPEERGLYKKMKVGEQAIYLSCLKGIDKKTAQKRLREWFEKFDIIDWWNKKVEELSKGMAQKIQFICTVIHEPDLLIFDEPFSGFDPINVNLLKQEILNLKAKGCTIIFSTHNMHSVEELCDDIALINASRVALSGTVADIRRQFDQGCVKMELGTDTPLTLDELAPFDVLDQSFSYGISTLRVKRKDGQINKDLPVLLPERAKLISLKDETLSMDDIFISTVQKKDTIKEEENKEIL